MCKRVRKGCTFSLWLFNVFIDEVVREAKRDSASGVKLSTGELGVLLFADDMVLMPDTAEELESNLKVMSQVLSIWDLKVNWTKTRVMRVARQKGRCEVKVDDEVIEQVDEMKYLGVMISSDGSIEKEVEARIGAARIVGGMSEAVLRRKELSKKTKLKVVNIMLLCYLH